MIIVFPFLNLHLGSAFKSLKRRLSEAEALITEQQAKLKQRDKKGLDTRVYQERDELQNCLQKSYDAFNEKYQENEQLKQKIQELKEALKLSKEANTQVIHSDEIVQWWNSYTLIFYRYLGKELKPRGWADYHVKVMSV